MAKNSDKPKSKYWLGVMYPENMIDGWQDKIDGILQLPYAYCIHDKDAVGDTGERKTHIHFILVFNNTTTYNHALETFRLLGEKAINTVQKPISIEHAWNYLIHDTDDARKDGKFLYSKAERITGNNFDIGDYVQLSKDEKLEMFAEIADYIYANDICDTMTLYQELRHNFTNDYLDIYIARNAALERLCRGNWHRRTRAENAKTYAIYAENQAHEQHEQHKKACPNCGSISIKKSGKTAADQQRYQCKDCNKTFI
jgi:predicted RNA-binding Zn-ribbon protein involved in translation (DUF1610 family)